MQDSRLFGSIPMFAGALVFMPACNNDTTPVTGDASTSSASSSSSTTAEPTETGTSPTTLDETGTTTIETTGDTVGPPVCISCSAEPLDGWFGPVTYARTAPGEPQPACPVEAAEQGPTLLDGFADPGPANCSCECEAPKPKGCYAYVVGYGGGGYSESGYYYYNESGYVPETGVYYGSTGGYGGGPGTGGGNPTDDDGGGGGGSSGGGGGGGSTFGGTGYYYGGSTGGYYYGGTTGGYYGGECWGNYTPINASCQNIPIEGGLRFVSYSPYYGGGGGACEKQQTTEIPEVAWSSTITTCRIPQDADPCEEGGICIPAPPAGFEAKWCLYRDGDNDCTNPEYPNKSVFWSGTDDSRDCSDCSCGQTVQSCDAAELMVYAEPDCAGEPTLVMPANGECTVIDGASVVGDFGLGDAACPVTEDSMAQGEVAPSGAFTFCCSD